MDIGSYYMMKNLGLEGGTFSKRGKSGGSVEVPKTKVKERTTPSIDVKGITYATRNRLPKASKPISDATMEKIREAVKRIHGKSSANAKHGGQKKKKKNRQASK